MEFEITALERCGDGGQMQIIAYGVGDKKDAQKDESPFFHTPRNSQVILNYKRDAVKKLGWKIGTVLVLSTKVEVKSDEKAAEADAK